MVREVPRKRKINFKEKAKNFLHILRQRHPPPNSLETSHPEAETHEHLEDLNLCDTDLHIASSLQ